jgi:hypothetical protein
MDLLKEDHYDVKLKVIEGFLKIAKIIGPDILTQPFLLALSNMTKDGAWRLREAVVKLVGDLCIEFGWDVYKKKLSQIFT